MLLLVENDHYINQWRTAYPYKLLREVSAISRKHLSDWHVIHEYFEIRDGLIIAKKGYCWNGCTMAPDLRSTMRASLFHDITYQAFELGLLELNFSNRRRADKLFLEIMKADGANWILRTTYFLGVRGFGGFFAYF